MDMEDIIVACMNEWPDSRFETLGKQLKQMEDELREIQKEKYAIAPSSFSYYLYEKKVEEFRSVWEQIDIRRGEEARQILFPLAVERIYRLLEQGMITEEDFPDQEDIREMVCRHFELCDAWKDCMMFMGPEPK